MKTTEVVTTTTVFASEVMPEVTTEDPALADVIAWADLNPTAWKIVTQSRSKAFGAHSWLCMGWAQGSKSSGAILERLRRFCTEIDATSGASIFAQSARFTLAHYRDKGFKSGFFQQWDGSYYRHCMTLDYTPKTLESVIDRFQKWCEGSACPYETVNIQVDKSSTFWRDAATNRWIASATFGSRGEKR